MTYHFDDIIDRHDTNSLKYDFHTERNKPTDALPLWVADMDFQSPKEVIDALQNAVSHGIFGYSNIKQDYFDAIHAWFLNRFGWNTQREWLVTTPGVVFALNLAVKAFTNPGDCILIQRPVYYPFHAVIEANQRKLINNPLHYENGVYTIDFKDLESKIIEHQVKLMIFCSPHNPVGRVWTKEELTKLGTLCMKHHVIIISDEIHADFVYPGHQHTILANVSKELADHTIICTAPSKTFNLAGFQVSNIFIANGSLRDRFKKEFELSGYSEPNCLGIVACKAAYTYGADWLEQLLVYLKGNADYVRDYLATHLPKVKMVELEGTYLVWLDFSAYGLTQEELEDRMLHQAKLWLDSGTMFGIEGTGFERINLASPRSVIEQAMKQLSEAFSEQ